jgi:GDPmannose 4,6-dehydratase
MRILTFGHDGQDGYYLERLCRQREWGFYGVSRKSGFVTGDVSDMRVVRTAISQTNPDAIINLAANSSIQHRAVLENNRTIVTGNLNILEAAYEHDKDVRVFVTGSGLQFKNNGNPVAWSDPFEGRDPYSVARIASVYQARYYRSLGMQVYVGYLFHHESPLRNKSCVSQMTLNAAKKRERFSIGDVDVKKEWGFAGDIADGIMTLLCQSQVFEATIGTGVAHSIKDWMSLCFSRFGLNWEDYWDPVPGYAPDFSTLISDTRVMDKLGWRHKTDLPGLLEIMDHGT